MISTAAFLFFLHSQLGQAAGQLVVKGAGYALADIHAGVQISLYNQESYAIAYRAYAIAYSRYVLSIQYSHQRVKTRWQHYVQIARR